MSRRRWALIYLFWMRIIQIYISNIWECMEKRITGLSWWTVVNIKRLPDTHIGFSLGFKAELSISSRCGGERKRFHNRHAHVQHWNSKSYRIYIQWDSSEFPILYIYREYPQSIETALTFPNFYIEHHYNLDTNIMYHDTFYYILYNNCNAYSHEAA